MEIRNQTEVDSGADKFFKMRMRNAGWDIQDHESVAEFIQRNGFPFTITYGDERDDN